ncbi:hypothetical protein Syun_031028 [Stephania yunnanensis]|uniref:beta-galactosidase n=1 Tax=Stephania yunnanensis TaxID=152371 RepID=A0AAP0E016_9MAGN
MGKGQAWVNGHNIGRFWSLVAPKDGCQETCDYRGAYNENKCAKNCGKLSQKWYHVPRSWLKSSDNLLVIFEETGGNPLGISVSLHYTRTICGSVSESDYPPLHRWTRQSSIHGRTSISNTTPEMQLQCDDGHVISDIVFASYGTPLGSCQHFSTGQCHADSSLSVVSNACLGRNNCSIEVSNAAFGSDPCQYTIKTLAVEASCKLSSNTGKSQL